MAVLDPLKVIVTNYDRGVEWLEVENNPEDPASGKRKIAFSREIYIEQDDFMEIPSDNYYRLSPGKMVRLKAAYIIRCDQFVKDQNGKVTELHCTYVPESRSGQDTSGLKVKSVIHWVDASHSITTEVRLYEQLFTKPDPASFETIHEIINPESLIILSDARLEKDMANAAIGFSYQFMRKGYFCLDNGNHDGKLVFNRTMTLKDSFSK